MTEIVLCKGFTHYVVSVNPGDTLSDLRKQIKPSIIDEDDSMKGIWRFSPKLYESGDQETVPKNAERLMKVYGDGGLIGSGKTLFVTNSRPAELIGATSTKFVKGQVECDIWGIDKFLTDKFRPMMFERVRAAEMTEVIYKNVLIGQEKTPLVIRVKVKGLSTFGCTIKRVSDNQPDAIIIDNLISTATADKNEAVLVVRQFPNEEKFVLIDALPDKKKKLEYRMQIEVWKVGNKQIIDVVDITVFSFKAFDDAKNFLALDPAA